MLNVKCLPENCLGIRSNTFETESHTSSYLSLSVSSLLKSASRSERGRCCVFTHRENLSDINPAPFPPFHVSHPSLVRFLASKFVRVK